MAILNLLIILFLRTAAAQNETMKLHRFSPVHVGVVLDLSTPLGKISNTSISMAMDDFYDIHDNYTTKLVLHTKDCQEDFVKAVAAATGLLGTSQVQAIIGPQKSEQAKFMSELVKKTQVPIISFSATSPSFTSISNPYFIRTTLNDSAQVAAIAAIIKAFGWRQAIPISDDTDYGRDILPYLFDALQQTGTHIPYHCLISLQATKDQIMEELFKLQTMQTRVFIIHMRVSVASRLLLLAKEAGMMDEGFVWIMTDGLTNLAESLSSSIIDSLQGAIGVKTYVPKSKKNESFAARWKKRFQQDHPDDTPAEMNNFALLAYDTVWALAIAAEKASVGKSDFITPYRDTKLPILESLEVSKNGPKLVEEILKCRFEGVTGKFKLINGQLQSSTFQIVNMVGTRERNLGFWDPKTGLSEQSKPKNGKTYSTLMTDLNQVVWPGESGSVPKGWDIPVSRKKLKILVPKSSFPEFVKVEKNASSNNTEVSGFSIEVFEAAVRNLPYALPLEYFAFESASGQNAGTYDDLIMQVYNHNYDGAVGDINIRENRLQYVDFTLPYTESGVYMIVPFKMVQKNIWIFLKPWSKDLWFGAIAFFLYTGFVVWVMEHKANPEFSGSRTHQLGTILHFSFSTMVYAHREHLENVLSKLVLIIWLFVVLILTSSYTASLASMLTVQKLEPSVTDFHQLIRNGDNVGTTNGSFLVDLLKKLTFDEKKVNEYNSVEEFSEALLKGSQNGGITAIFEGLPFVQLIIKQQCANFTVVGPIFKNQGLGFAFPIGSPLVHDISRALLKVVEGDEITNIENKWLVNQTSCQIQGNTISSNHLDFNSFGGLFLITGTVSTFALSIFVIIFIHKNWHKLRSIGAENNIWRRFATSFNCYNNSRNLTLSAKPPNREISLQA
ncbi:glutamate receptor 2.7-like [Dendrobium catenatum]|uniref:glutamate receptor 2.7-like n=1 Tax=Dendrobium catenatum TaxID=906689 RepID=UPI00109F3F89|nr:glutamate receptor 2.7-like [Dendrobium catenatum]